VDAEAQQALRISGDERCQHWANMQRLLLQKHHILPLAAPRYYWFAHGVDVLPYNQFIEPYSLALRLNAAK
jgi:hypothetical protein